MRSKRLKGKAAARKPSLFYSLPPELRNEIYAICFTRSIPIHAISTRDALRIHQRPGQELHLPVALLGTSKQIYAEASSFLYENRIVFGGFRSLSAFVDQIGVRNTHLLRYICVSITKPEEQLAGLAEYSSAFKNLINIKELLLGFNYYSMRNSSSAKAMAAIFYEHARSWCEAWGKKSGEKDAILTVLRVHYWFRWWGDVDVDVEYQQLDSLYLPSWRQPGVLEAALQMTYNNVKRERGYEKRFLKELGRRLLTAS